MDATTTNLNQTLIPSPVSRNPRGGDPGDIAAGYLFETTGSGPKMSYEVEVKRKDGRYWPRVVEFSPENSQEPIHTYNPDASFGTFENAEEYGEWYAGELGYKESVA